MKKITIALLIIALPVMAFAQKTRTPLTPSTVKVDTLNTPVLSLKDIQQFVSNQIGNPQTISPVAGSFTDLLSKYLTKDVYDKIVSPAIWNVLLPALSQAYAEKLKEILTNSKTNQ